MQAEMQRCLETCDVSGVRGLWNRVAPHLPQPTSDEDALIAIHTARTQAGSIAFKLRAYSHAWLRDRGLPSLLPDQLKARAERAYPRIAEAVGVSVNVSDRALRPVAQIIQRRIGEEIQDAYDSGIRDPLVVRHRMGLVRDHTRAEIFGRLAIDRAPVKAQFAKAL